MVWCSQATSRYQSQCWCSSLLWPYGVTRPQWVKECQTGVANYSTILLQHCAKPFLLCLADTSRRLALSCLVLPHLVWPQMNHSHTCLILLAKLAVNGLHNVRDHEEHPTCVTCEMDNQIYWKITMLKIAKSPDKTRGGKTRQDKTRLGGTQRR